jgi:hypothetical protein
MTKFEIVEKLREYIQSGELISKSRNGADYHGFDKAVHNKELFRTLYANILASSLEVSNWFNDLIKNDRVMKSEAVGCKHRELTSDYLISKVCMRGEIIKFDDFGQGCIVYIE